MNNPGTIVFHKFCGCRGNTERIEYEWQGGAEIWIARDLLDSGEFGRDWAKTGKLQIGPYRLRLIEQDRLRNDALFIREDYPFWRLVVAWHKYNRVPDLFYRRLIITLAVWRLARYREATIPTWRDVYILDRLAQSIRGLVNHE